MLLYGAVAQALASVELRRWIDACLNNLMRNDWIHQLQSGPILLLLTPVLLSILSQRIPMAPQRSFTARRGSGRDTGLSAG
ncbi:hypothetical protein MTO96_051977 [Rhipicephalus appendiculatus]